MEKLMRRLRLTLFFIATLLIYLGIPLLGRGLGDRGGYFLSGSRLGYAFVVGIFSLAAGVQAYTATKGIRGGKEEENKFIFRQRIVRIILVLSLYIALFFIPFFDRHGMLGFGDGVYLRWLGVSLSALGFALVYGSGVAVGKQYSANVTIKAGDQLITEGIYRFICHTRYLGVIILSIGVSCIFCSWIGLVASVVFIAILLYRIKDEEAAMHKEFGGEWKTYCKRSWRLIPNLY
jgi:protein-S-isoprenylcysteine O-methyltransferase Ste14